MGDWKNKQMAFMRLVISQRSWSYWTERGMTFLPSHVKCLYRSVTSSVKDNSNISSADLHSSQPWMSATGRTSTQNLFKLRLRWALAVLFPKCQYTFLVSFVNWCCWSISESKNIVFALYFICQENRTGVSWTETSSVAYVVTAFLSKAQWNFSDAS